MRTRVWRIAVFSMLIFGLGCVGCSARPTSTRPAVPPPTRMAGASAPTPAPLVVVPAVLTFTDADIDSGEPASFLVLLDL